MPVILSGGMEGAEHVRAVFEHTGAAAVMLARGALGNPWLFAQLLGARDDGRRRREEIARRVDVGRSTAPRSTSARAAPPRYLRKFHPWYVERLARPARQGACRPLQQTATSPTRARAAGRAARPAAPSERPDRRRASLYCALAGRRTREPAAQAGLSRLGRP